MSNAREFWAIRNVRKDSYELRTIKPKWEEIPLGDERIHVIEYKAYEAAVKALKRIYPLIGNEQNYDTIFITVSETLKELGEHE